MREFAEDFISFLKVKVLQKNSSYGNFFHRELFVWSPLCFTMDIVIFLREWSIAVPRTASRAVKNIEEFPMKAYYIQKDFLDIGKSTSNFNGIILPVYDRERTICDCFKYRTKLDNEIFNKAVNAYAADEKKNLVNLSKYAKEMKLYTKVMNVMEVLLNG